MISGGRHGKRGAGRPSACHTRLQIEDHLPQPIDLAALDDLERFESPECLVRRIEPGRNGFGRDDLGKSFAKSLELLNPAKTWLANRLAALRIGDRPLGKFCLASTSGAPPAGLGDVDAGRPLDGLPAGRPRRARPAALDRCCARLSDACRGES